MDIRELNSEKYSGKAYSVKYYTKGYFDIHQEMDAFTFRYCPLEQEEEHILQDEILAGWLCNPIAYGAFKDNKLVGYVEGYLEKWNNRYRISNIAVKVPHSLRKATVRVWKRENDSPYPSENQSRGIEEEKLCSIPRENPKPGYRRGKMALHTLRKTKAGV